jgi:predicted RNase H-like nuclease
MVKAMGRIKDFFSRGNAVTHILALDAAWTRDQPTGVALLRREGGRAVCRAVAPSCAAFGALARGQPIRWGDTHRGAAIDVNWLIEQTSSFDGVRDIDVIAVDMPLATTPITGRRAADRAISRRFAAAWCSAHSPSAHRPGKVADSLHADLARRGYTLATRQNGNPGSKHLLEVYPHPALLRLLGLTYRLPYKQGKTRKYWPSASRAQRVANVVTNLRAIDAALRQWIDGIELPLPHPDDDRLTLTGLKPFEDAIDALVSAWAGLCYATDQAQAFGDETASIWVPDETTALPPDRAGPVVLDEAHTC